MPFRAKRGIPAFSFNNKHMLRGVYPERNKDAAWQLRMFSQLLGFCACLLRALCVLCVLCGKVLALTRKHKLFTTEFTESTENT